MALDKLLDLLAYGEPRPINLTIYWGKKIKSAREEAELSQEELTRIIRKRRATISDIESGKGEVETCPLGLLADILKKLLVYFYPSNFIRKSNKKI